MWIFQTFGVLSRFIHFIKMQVFSVAHNIYHCFISQILYLKIQISSMLNENNYLEVSHLGISKITWLFLAPTTEEETGYLEGYSQ